MRRDSTCTLATFAVGLLALVAAAKDWPPPPPGYIYERDLRPHTLVMTNASAQAIGAFSAEAGKIMRQDIDDKRAKYDLAIYRDSVVKPYRLHSRCLPIYVETPDATFVVETNVLTYVTDGGSIIVKGANIGHFKSISFALHFEIEGNACTNVSVIDSRDASKEITLHFGAIPQPFVARTWPRLEAVAWPNGDRLALKSDIVPPATSFVEKVHYFAQRELSRDIAVNGVTLTNGEIFAGLAFSSTNLVGIIPVIGTTAAVRVYAPFAQGAYLPNRFSAIEIGDFYQMLFAQRAQIGSMLYLPNPQSVRFLHTMSGDDSASALSLEEYFHETYIPRNGGGRINGELHVDGALRVNGIYRVENADIIAKGFSVIDRVLVSDSGMVVSGGICRVNHVSSANGVDATSVHVSGLDRLTYNNSAGTKTSLAAHLAGLKSDILVEASVAQEKPAERVSSLPILSRPTDVGMSIWDRTWTLQNRRMNVMSDANFPYTSETFGGVAGGKTIYFPWFPNDFVEGAEHHSISLSVYIDYKTQIPHFLWGVYGPDEGGWRIVSDRADVFDLAAGVPTVLTFQQIDSDTLMVSRRDVQHNVTQRKEK